MPRWVQEGYAEYARRLPAQCRLKLVEVVPGHRGKGADLKRTVRDEGERILKTIPKECYVLALDVKGRAWSTEQLSDRLQEWMGERRNPALLIGGPEGLHEHCLQRADEAWSLSKLTLPHPLVRVVVAEQLYRAWSILHNTPYHRV